jgi:hypothetical protein
MTVCDDVVRPCKALQWRDVLEINEALLVDVLLARGGAMARPELEAECIARGMKRVTFYSHLSYSPVITRYRRGVYGLRGVPVPPGTAEVLAPVVMRGRVLVDGGWIDSGRVWLGYRASKAMLSNGVCTVPVFFRSVLRGDYRILCNGLEYGLLRVAEYQGWGLGPLLRRASLWPGDVIVLEFSLTERKVDVKIGTEELLVEYQESAGSSGSVEAKYPK